MTSCKRANDLGVGTRKGICIAQFYRAGMVYIHGFAGSFILKRKIFS